MSTEHVNVSGVFVHSHSLIEPNVTIGRGTRIWAFAHVLSGTTIGADCNVCDHVFLESVTIGDRVTIKCGVQLWKGVTVGSDVFIGPNATFTNDRFPRSKRHLSSYPATILEDGCSIGANATILPGVTIGRGAMVGAGTVVTKSVPPHAIVTGNPSEIVGYVDTSPEALNDSPVATSKIQDIFVRGVSAWDLPVIQDLRGDLSVGEFSKTVPFKPLRYFIVYNVRNRQIRGEHAHRKCRQFLVCVAGSCRVVVDDGVNRQEVALESPAMGLAIEPMVWSMQYKYSANAILLVFASDFYDANDYIRDYKQFLVEAKMAKAVV